MFDRVVNAPLVLTNKYFQSSMIEKNLIYSQTMNVICPHKRVEIVLKFFYH